MPLVSALQHCDTNATAPQQKAAPIRVFTFQTALRSKTTIVREPCRVATHGHMIGQGRACSGHLWHLWPLGVRGHVECWTSS